MYIMNVQILFINKYIIMLHEVLSKFKESYKETPESKFRECLERMKKSGSKKFSTKDFSISWSGNVDLGGSISIKDKMGERKLSLFHNKILDHTRWTIEKDKFQVQQRNERTKKLEKVEATKKIIEWLLKKIDLYTKEIEVLSVSKNELKDLDNNIMKSK